MARVAGRRAISDRRLLAALVGGNLLGLCLFDAAGQVVAREGLPLGIGPAQDANAQDYPVFAGIWDLILGLRSSPGAIDLPGLGASAHTSARYDLRIAWLADLGVFVAMFTPADARIGFEFEAAQAARENRLLLERIRQQQEQIEAQNALLRTFIDRVPAAVAMLDSDFNYVMASERWVKDFHSPQADLAGLPFRDGLGVASKRLEQALRRKDGAGRSGVEQMVGADGAVIWHRWAQEAWDHPGFAPGGRLVFAENITQSVEQTHRLRAQARRLTALTDQMRAFALAASHDLRAPLRQIAAFAAFLEADHSPTLNQEGQEFVHLICQSANRMMAMMDALLRFARVTYQETAATTFRLDQAIAAARANLRQDFEALGAQLNSVGDIQLRADFSLFVILFQNLIDNALKYAGGDALRIEVRVSQDVSGVIILFSDNGPGIPPARQARAFDLFQRLGAAAAIPGNGVGLALCRKIVELHGGEIEIAADHASGLQFAIRLPNRLMRQRRPPRRREPA